MSCEALEPIRSALEAHNYPMILESRAKIFVHPCHYEAVLDSIQRQQLKLFADHIVIEHFFEEAVVDVLKKIVKPKTGKRLLISLSAHSTSGSPQHNNQAAMGKVDCESVDEEQRRQFTASSTPASSANSLLAYDMPVTRTFIHFKIPSSLYTPSATHANTK